MEKLSFDPGEVVHVLTYGVSLCQTPKGLPHEWPALNKWVRATEFEAVPAAHKCSGCQKRMAVDGPRLIRSVVEGKAILHKKNPCPVRGCTLRARHFGDHLDRAGTKFSELKRQ